jgi:eukaryotic-like serine/threonine-protein kinase
LSEPYSRVPADSAEATRYLQDSIAGFARIIFVLASVMLVASLILAGVGVFGVTMRQHLLSPTQAVHLTAELVLLAVWWRCRGSTLRVSTLVAIDATLTIFLCASWAMLALGLPRSEPIEFSILLAITHTLIARSVFVPSSFRQTLWIGAVGVLPGMGFIAHRGMEFAVVSGSPGRVATFIVFSALWSAAAAITSALNSRKIFGLRAHIREVGKLGQYTLQEKLGEGGMGVVYRATHAMLRRPAAIKLLHPERSGATDLARFEREVQSTSRLTHPNTISIFDYGRTADGAFYYVMEYLEGLDLEQLVEEDGPVEAARAAWILAQASGSLAEAHARGLIHRDIKPANIMLTERPDEPDVVKVVDFGLVKAIEGLSGDVAATNLNAITGTPLYLAPEAITSPDAVDARSDLYALGAVGYFLLTGHNVFEAKTVVEVLGKHLNAIPVPLSERLGKPVPEDLAALILSCLAKSPEGRPASAAALRTGLRASAAFARYDAAAATAWWRARGTARFRGRTTAARTAGSPPTMMVDLKRRAG